MQRQEWMKIDESGDFLKLKLDMEILKRRWPGRYIFLIEKKRYPEEKYVLYLKHGSRHPESSG